MASENSSMNLGLRREIKRPTKHEGEEVTYIGVGRRVISGSRKQKKDSDPEYEPDSASDELCENSSLKAVTKNVDKPSKPDKRHAGPATADKNRQLMTRVSGVDTGHGRELTLSTCEDEYEDGEEEIRPRGPRVTRPSQPIPYKPFNPFKAAEAAVFPTKDRITEAPTVVDSATFKATPSVQPWISGAVKNNNTNTLTLPQRSRDITNPLIETPNPPILTRPTPVQLRRINTTYKSLKQAQSDPKHLQYLGVTFTPDGKPIHDLSTAVSKHLAPFYNPDFDKPFPTQAADGAKRRAEKNQDAFQSLHPMLKNLIVSELLDDSASELVASATTCLPVITIAVVEQLLGVEKSVIERAKEEAAKLREEAWQERSVPQREDVVAALRWLTERCLPGSLVCLYSELYDIDVSEPVGPEDMGVVMGEENMENQDSGVELSGRDVSTRG